MTSHIDGLLDRAQLVQQPYAQAEIDAAEARLAGRVGAALPCPPAPSPPTQGVGVQPAAHPAWQDLTTLCETLVAQPLSLTSLRRFLARALPEPIGARVLGCLLQLAERTESARFWWQYAAGAGDYAATYCLYLHHRALGEDHVAHWWHTQSHEIARQTDWDTVDVATALRLLRALKPDDARVPEPVHAVLGYVPAAVTFVDDDLDLPLPDEDFTDRIHALTTPPTGRLPAYRGRPTPLPERRRGAAWARWTRRTDNTVAPAPSHRA
ncbi:hypothetical protein [Streptomyces sp. NBC_01304]|uniref:hypothetical protein n=1 Tax=Streptomyces sp. NBC_01304 TaxID=2903818 RepID=UPI002E0D31EB|nr:hypothetical protein OG430_11400 [Streptomyces sp. NBC_01304]